MFLKTVFGLCHIFFRRLVYRELPYQTYDFANYLMLFDQSTGYLVLISGESDIETLEHIAYEMEIRESSSPRIEYTGGVPIGAIDLARG